MGLVAGGLAAYWPQFPGLHDSVLASTRRVAEKLSGFGAELFERAWDKVGRWVRAAGVARALRTGRFGLMGHLYPGMLDVSTDLTLIPTRLGGHVEVLEFDDLREYVNAAGPDEVDAGLRSGSRWCR